jgi:hypothetical protein
MMKRFTIYILALLIGLPALAASSNNNGHKRNVDDNDTVAIPGNVHPNARAQNDAGPTDQNLRYERMILVLNPRPNSKERPDQVLAQLYDSNSSQYHHWLTPQDYAKHFGVTDDDLADVTAWLQRRGFSIDEVGAGRGWINFSGTVGQVERAFKTQIHEFKVNGKNYHANTSDPQIPRALTDIVGGVATLHNFPKQSLSVNRHPVSMPEYTSGTSHYVAPADFSTIYNTNALYSAGVNGSGQTIAIVGRTDIALADVQYFRSFFGLPANDPQFVHNGTDPGNLGSGEEGEADLDVEWSGAVAPNATIKFVISASTQTTDGVDLSAQYIVNNNLAPVMSTSFGQCESSMGSTETTFYNNLWSQAASQGISSFVSSGDSGAAGCNGGSDTTGSGKAVSGLASTPYNIAVGGAQFNDTASPSTYWNSTNNSTNQSSAKSYIPEIAWNESANVSGGSGLWASAGGVSTLYAKPSWQACVGVPADGKRDVPDVALTAAGHDGYLVIQGHTSTVSGLGAVGGTSASSPSFAGLMALVVQKTGTRQGNANTKFYSLANAQYSGTPGAATIFHDVTSGNNSVPGVTGFNCGTGYDAVTGVGTVDANAMVNNWNGTATSDFSISASPTAVSIAQGAAGSSSITTSISGTFNSAISLSATGAPSGTTVSFSPASIAAPGNGSSTMTITVGSSTATGNYTITVTGTGGVSHSTNVSLTVTASGGGGSIFSDGFESSGWSTAQVSGTAGAWTIVTASTHPAISAHGGTHWGDFNSYTSAAGNQTRIYRSSSFAIPSTFSTVSLTFWMYHETGYSTANDQVQLQFSTNGTTWSNVGSAVSRYNGSTGWAQVTIDVSSYKGQTVYLGFLGISQFGNDEYIDDVAVTGSGTGGGGDTTAPTTSITAPTSGATVSGTTSVTASASDNVGVTKVEFYLDGTLQSTDTTSPYSWSWNTTTSANGSHSLVSKAYDAAGNIGTSATVTVTVSNSTGSQQLLGNPGFENGSTNTAPWTTTSGVVDSSASEAAHSGTWKAWMNGYGTTHTDSIVQTVAVPSTVTTATLAFWLHIDTAETTTTVAYDTLKVQIRNSSGTVLATLATYSNLNKNTGYAQKSFDVSAYKGQTIQVYLLGSEDSSAQTSFVVDDFTLNVQ